MDMTREHTIHPQVIERQCDDWLAVTPKGCPVRIGAAGSTEELSPEQFAQLIGRWAAARKADRSALK